MQAYIITIKGHAYSEACAARCEASAKGIRTTRFDAVTNKPAEAYGLKWTWRDSGQCPKTGMLFHSYGGGLSRVGCALSHYLLWKQCAESGEPMLVLEHDAVFLRPFEPVEFGGICMVNDPTGATPHGAKWANIMVKRGAGVFPKTHIQPDNWPDGLAGNSAYMIKPRAAARMVELAHDIGMWHNDALMCRQLIGLQELYPFMTCVRQTESTTCPKTTPAQA